MPTEAGTRAKLDRARDDRTFQVPPFLRARLNEWIDVEEVGQAGFWRWLETVLPALPSAREEGAGPLSSRAPDAIRVRELARDLVDCARDRAQLTIMSDQYFRDNQVLAVRLKSVESALATTRATGRPPDVDEDTESADAAERYLPRK